MAFTIQLDPEVERRLAEQARLHGVSLAKYIQEIIERQLALQTSERKLSEEEFEAALDAMTIYSDKIPVLPLDALRREEIYRDHD
jgi:predicted DNA-binding protein